jgi:4-diphosphocytidyl-2-C-methyl-D-erythritol kinase
MITLKAYAKLNLSLDVTGKREDGYHELDTIMQSISLYDTVSIEKADGISVRMDKDWANEQDNTAYKAAMAFLKLTGSGGADISIQKRIPRMAGLGGASADAAAVLVGLDRLYETALSFEAMNGLAVSVGADVPFALTGGLARAKGIGERLTPLKASKPIYYAVVKPHQGVSTAEAFRCYCGSAHVSIDSVKYAVLKGDTELFARYAGNALGMAALSVAPAILKAADALKAAGAAKAFMTGSGSAMFAVFDTEQTARNAAERVKGDFELCGAFRPMNTGVEITGE